MRMIGDLGRSAALVVVLILGSATVARAAAVTWSPNALGMAWTVALRCTSAGLTVTQNLASGTVTSVTVGGLPSACGLATLQVTVNNGSTTGSGSATVPAAGGSVTVTLSAAPAVTAAEETDLVLTGP